VVRSTLAVAGWLAAGWIAGCVVRSLRDQYIVGATASFPVATLEQVDASLARCRRALQRTDLSPTRFRNLHADIDKLLDRRLVLLAQDIATAPA
jgi:hypothetical protein